MGSGNQELLMETARVLVKQMSTCSHSHPPRVHTIVKIRRQ